MKSKMHIDMCFKYAEIGGHEMTQTPRQREEFERKRKSALDKLEEDIDDLSDRLEVLIKERDRIEEMTFEDSYFEFISEKEIDR